MPAAVVVVNEVSSTGSNNLCGGNSTAVGEDWIELHNTNPTTPIDIVGFKLGDPGANFTIPSSTIIPANGYALYCRNAPGSFPYGIGGTDTINLFNAAGDLISTTGNMANLGTATRTFQRKPDGSYAFSDGTPLTVNVFFATALDAVVVNEISNTGNIAPCGADYIELYNRDVTTAINIGGYVLRDDTNNTFVIPDGTVIAGNDIILYCQNANGSFTFGIGGTDSVTLYDAANVVRSTTGALPNGGGSAVLTYQRRPNGTFSYTKPTPNITNVFFSAFVDVVVVNEVGATGNAFACSSPSDYVELLNTGNATVDLTNFVLHDNVGPNSTARFTFPSGSAIAPGQFLVLCEGAPFTFGIGGTDSITLLDPTGDQLSFSGVLTPGSSATASWQRSSNGIYSFAPPTPGAANAVSSDFKPVINEVAPAGTSNSSICGGQPFVEILNTGVGALNLSGYVLHDSTGSISPTAFVFNGATPTIPALSFGVYCKGQTFQFDIESTDTISLSNSSGGVISTTGMIGGSSPRPNNVDLTWVRYIDFVNATNPPSYQYSVNPSPGRPNVFSFVPQNSTLKTCSVQTQALSCLADYEFRSLVKLVPGPGRPANPELSGGTFDGSTCTELFVGDEGTINEVAINGSTVTLKRAIPFIGGSRDTEGLCYWSVGKIAIVDERERSGK